LWQKFPFVFKGSQSLPAAPRDMDATWFCVQTYQYQALRKNTRHKTGKMRESNRVDLFGMEPREDKQLDAGFCAAAIAVDAGCARRFAVTGQGERSIGAFGAQKCEGRIGR
jgi:hypothetical protein